MNYIQISVEMTLKYILGNHQCLSLHSAVHFTIFQKTIKVIVKLHTKMHLSLT